MMLPSPKQIIVLILMLQMAACACNASYYQANSTCLPCDANCLSCSLSATNCTSCQTQFYLSSNACWPCNASCAACVNSLRCSSCTPGYRLSNDKCQSCQVNCAVCSVTTCMICIVGFDISVSCAACSRGYFWNTTASTCSYCGLGCGNCTNNTICISCIYNYRNDNGTCVFVGYNQPTETYEDNQQYKIAIILAAVFGGLLFIVFVSYIVYRCFFFKKRSKTQQKAQAINQNASALGGSNANINEQHQESPSKCGICKRGNANVNFPCGHHFHHRCLKKKKIDACSICPIIKEIQEIKQKPLYLDQVLDATENQSQVASQVNPRQEKYQYEEASVQGTVNLEYPKIQFE